MGQITVKANYTQVNQGADIAIDEEVIGRIWVELSPSFATLSPSMASALPHSLPVEPGADDEAIPEEKRIQKMPIDIPSLKSLSKIPSKPKRRIAMENDSQEEAEQAITRPTRRL